MAGGQSRVTNLHFHITVIATCHVIARQVPHSTYPHHPPVYQTFCSVGRNVPHPVMGLALLPGLGHRIAKHGAFDIPSSAKLTLLHVVRVRNEKSWQTMSLMRMMRRCSGGFLENTWDILPGRKRRHLRGRTTRVQQILCQIAIRTEYAMSEDVASV